MNRRQFLATLASLPLVGCLFRGEPDALIVTMSDGSRYLVDSSTLIEVDGRPVTIHEFKAAIEGSTQADTFYWRATERGKRGLGYFAEARLERA